MLGVRLDPETEQGLARLARRTRRSKSDIAREAIGDYLAARTADPDLERELQLIAAATNNEDLDILEAMHDDLSADTHTRSSNSAAA